MSDSKASSLNRRLFLQTSSMAAALATSAGGYFTSSAAAQQDRKLGVALVGLGSLSTNQIAPALQKTEHCKLAAIVTGTPAKAEKWSKQYDIADEHIYNYETFDKIADDDAVDIIYIVLPNGMHAEYTIRAAKAGKHVFCEKPMANSSEECRQMIAACEKARKHLGIGYRCQFEPHHLQCIEFARNKRFGELMYINAGFGFKIGDPNQWRLDADLAGGGALMDVGIYALQACRYLTGEEPVEVLARETKTDPKKFAEVDETIAWTMKFPSGVLANCSTTYNFGGVNHFHAYCGGGQFSLDPAYSYNGIKGTSSAGPIEKPEIDQFAAELDAFAKVVAAGEPNRVPGEEGLRDLLVIEAIYKAAREVRPVTPEKV